MHNMEESESELFLENTFQLHYSIEANRSMEDNNRKKLSRHFLKWKKKTRKTVNISHAVHDIDFYIRSWIYRESLITQQPKY